MHIESMEGHWWLPNHQNQSIPGVLSCHNSGIILSLSGAFPNTVAEGSTELPSEPIILGTIYGGRQVTLHGCRQTEILLNVAGIDQGSFGVKTAYDTQVAYFGGHFFDVSDIAFYRLEVEYSHLPDWAGLNGFREQRPEGSSVGSKSSYSLVYESPAPLAMQTSLGSVTFSTSMERARYSLRQLTLQQHVVCEFSGAGDLPLNVWLIDYVHPLQQLLSLATSRPNRIMSITGYSHKVQIPFDIFALTRMMNLKQPPVPEPERPIFILPNTLVSFDEIEEQSLARHMMLFTLADVRDELADVLNGWFAASQSLDSVYSLYFGVLFSEEMGTQQRFMNLVQAAESYHRRRFPNEVLPESQHEARLASILEAAPTEQRTWLQEKLQYSNEPSLKKRLVELFARAEVSLATLVGDTNKKQKAYAQRVTDTRNYLTHYNEALRSRAATGDDLIQMTRVIELLMQVCFLRELNISPERCEALLKQSATFLTALNGGKNI